jgi:hypothetical protein
MEEKTFISYSRSDSDFALKLAEDLRAANVAIWIDVLDIPAGDTWDRAVQNALQACTSLLVVLSPAAAASRSVMDEVSFALDENKRTLPVIYQDCDVPFRLRRVQHTDFTADYTKALSILIDALGGDQITADSKSRSSFGGPTESGGAVLSNDTDRASDDSQSTEVSDSSGLTQRARSLVAINLCGILGFLAIVWIVCQRAFRLRQGDPLFDRYHGEIFWVIAALGLFCLLLVIVGIALGAEGRRAQLRSLVTLGWILAPLSVCNFFYNMFLGNRGSHGELFTIPYKRYYTQFSGTFQMELLIAMLVAIISIWVLVRHRRKGKKM